MAPESGIFADKHEYSYEKFHHDELTYGGALNFCLISRERNKYLIYYFVSKIIYN
jgi:hypothetical protein